MHLPRHPAIQRAAIGIAIWATAVVAWRVFDTPIQRQVERQVGPDVLVHIGMVVTAFISIAMTLAAITLLWKAYAVLRKLTARRLMSPSCGAAPPPGPADAR